MRLTYAVSICNDSSLGTRYTGRRHYGRIWLQIPMIRSMTGFARRERQFPWGLLSWELKTVNHRFLEIGCRLPEDFRSAEADFRQTISGVVKRGKVDVSLHFRPVAAANSLEVDADLLGSLTQRAQQIAAAAGSA